MKNCRKATWLIEKKLVGSLTVREELALKIHLAACSGCSLFERDSILINKLVTGGMKLDDDFKKKLQHQINETIKNK